MAKGYQKNKERLAQVSLLGKTLVRRAKKKCELCGTQGESMSVMEVEPAPATPAPDHALMACTACRTVLEQDNPDPNQSRFLETAAWSEIPAVQVTAIRLCRKLADNGVDWARELMDMVYISPEVKNWLGE